MIAFPNCKINLGLNILQKRPDDYHDLETVFYPVAFKDILEVVEADHTELHLYGLPVPGDSDNNLCVKAYQLLKTDFASLPEAAIHLYKNIPAGAGLGGGSADGAAMLLLVNAWQNLGLSEDQLTSYALQLGSDCPFFIRNKPCFASGRGESMTAITLDLSAYSMLLVCSGIHIDTGRAFSWLSPHVPNVSVKRIIADPVETWKGRLINDFEEPAMREFPALALIKKQLYESGALYASMTGSGSAFYGIFKKDQLPSISFDQSFLVKYIN